MYLSPWRTLRKTSIIVGSDRAFELSQERFWRKQLHFRHWLKCETATCRQWIAWTQFQTAERLIAPTHGCDHVRADVPFRAIADTINGLKDRARLRLASEFAIAEAQARTPVVVDFNYEVTVENFTAEEIASRLPAPTCVVDICSRQRFGDSLIVRFLN